MEEIRIDQQTSSVSLPSMSKAKDNSFTHRLNDAMEQVSRGSMGIHEGMLAISKADLSLRLLIQVRNKVMEAYREISRMGF